MRRVVVLALLAVVATVREADACTCAVSSFCRVYAASDAVFSGTVLDVREPERGPKVARLRVARAYKGVPRARAIVSVTLPGGSSESCSLDIEKGQRWVIYAGREGDAYASSACSGSYLVEASARSPDLPPVPGSVTGVLERDDDDGDPHGVRGVSVWVDTPTGRVTSRTGAGGRFLLRGVPPGRRTVTFDVGRGEAAEADVELESNTDCADVRVSVEPGGGLVGTVVDASGSPLANVWVRLMSSTAATFAPGSPASSGWLGSSRAPTS